MRLGISASLGLLVLLGAFPAFGQRDRLQSAINNGVRVALSGHVPRGIAQAVDLGPDDPTALRSGTLALTPSAAQRSELDQLLKDQQNPASPLYHRWLTPQQYGQRFGVSQRDIDAISSWLRDRNLSVDSVPAGRNRITFHGSVASLEAAFGTSIHRFDATGEIHFANISDPTIPAAMAGLVIAVQGLHDFRLRPAARNARRLAPNYTSASGNHYLGPDDFAVIYNVRPLYNLGIDGSGQKVAVVGQTQLPLSDVRQFRTYFNLPANDPVPVLVPNKRDPGISDDDMIEAHLDVEWAGAVARNAQIFYVYSYDVTDALEYAIDANIAPVVSMSYGLCESALGGSYLDLLRALALQANAQGMTWVTSSGDSGANDCYLDSRAGGLSVDAPASIPEVTGIGGTTLTEGSGTYWSPANDPGRASALSYIPETAWNDSPPTGTPSATGGGASHYFSRPPWQTGAGVPEDNTRSVPDIALAASANHVPYMIFSDGSLQYVGGTSAGAPAFSGVLVLISHYQTATGDGTSGLGNVNPRLYALAQSAPSAFHDITSGNNIVGSCGSARTRSGCTNTPIGYNAGPGYDLATGLGSIDAFAMVTSWRNSVSAAKNSAVLIIDSNATVVDRASGVVLRATVRGVNGGLPTGTVLFSAGSTRLGVLTLESTGAEATGTLKVDGSLLQPGNISVSGVYSGDANFAPSAANLPLRVSSSLSLGALVSGASFRQTYAPGMIMAVFGTQLATRIEAAGGVPLPTTLADTTVEINGVPAPLYYVSPDQINVQVPYWVEPNTTASVKVTTYGQSVTGQFRVAASAPGIFTTASGAPAGDIVVRRGQIATLYITGEGLLTSAVASGSTPPPGVTPKPALPLSVTIGGAIAPTEYVGVPSWSVGVTQINYTVPATAPLGAQPIVVTVGGVSSAAATLTVSQ